MLLSSPVKKLICTIRCAWGGVSWYAVTWKFKIIIPRNVIVLFFFLTLVQRYHFCFCQALIFCVCSVKRSLFSFLQTLFFRAPLKQVKRSSECFSGTVAVFMARSSELKELEGRWAGDLSRGGPCLETAGIFLDWKAVKQKNSPLWSYLFFVWLLLFHWIPVTVTILNYKLNSVLCFWNKLYKTDQSYYH